MRIGLTTLLLLSAGTAWALPVDQSAEGSVDDARLILALPEKVIEGDRRTRCGLRIIVGSEHVPFSHGDTVTVELFEDDPIRDDEVFRQVLEVGPLEVGGGHFDRTIDCSGEFGDDGGDSIELYAKALVEKDDCGFACRQDRPQTDVLTLQVVGDDTAEELDDQAAGAAELSEGVTSGRVARDDDWYVLRATTGVRTRIDLLHRPAGGELSAWIQGDAGVVENRLTPTHEGARMEADLTDGIWFFGVTPTAPDDPNFYDVRLTHLALEPVCTPGETRTTACGACGEAEQRCDEGGQWSALGPDSCQGEGVCRPGDTLQAACDRCGRREDLCGEGCAWAEGVCADQGECSPGTWHTEDCALEGPAGSTDGVRSRVCRDSCTWSAYGPCRVPEGPGGACLPESEDCADGVDNDCDGAADADDLDCAADQAGGWRLGLSDPCTTSSDCDPDPARALECIGPPSHPAFEDGYCAQVGCVFPDACEDAGGVCGVAFNQVFCLRPCTVLADCRLGHHCASLGESAATGQPIKACLPVCRGHADCRDGPKTFCNPRNGRCTPPPDTLPGAGAATPAGGDDDGGCLSIAAPASPRSPWVGVASLLRR